MDGQQPNFELPPPVIPGGPEQFNSPEQPGEHLMSRPELNDPGVPPPTMLPPQQVAAPGIQHTLNTQLPAAPTQDLPSLADDADLIEKEWVTKAKHIVSNTKTDPYRQNKEISKFKAGYIKKRYNKDIRVSEE